MRRLALYRIIQSMNGRDALAPEYRDPFYIPDRMPEALGFLGGGAMGVLAALAPFLVASPYSASVVATMMLGPLAALLALLSGLKARRHRLDRIRMVTDLRAAISRPNHHARGTVADDIAQTADPASS